MGNLMSNEREWVELENPGFCEKCGTEKIVRDPFAYGHNSFECPNPEPVCKRIAELAARIEKLESGSTK